MTRVLRTIAVFLLLLSCFGLLGDDGAKKSSDPMASCPMHAQHTAAARTETAAADGSAEHGRHVDGRHDTFGMSHTTSVHSFRLFADGGAIELRAIDSADTATVTAIRTHLQQIAPQFTKGDFSTPQFVHGKAPQGVAQLSQLREVIAYRYEPLDAGGRIRITTSNPEALRAIHAFLRFQVTEHRTANSGEVEEDSTVTE